MKQVTENSLGIGSLSTGRIYDFKVTTIDAAGNESGGETLTSDVDGLGL